MLCATSSATAVDLVAEPGEHRQWRQRDGRGDGLVVERGQLAATATAANDHHHIEIAVATQRAHTGGDLGDGPFALHPHIHHAELEGQRAAFDLVHEVGPGSTGHAGDHAYPQRSRRYPTTPVAVVEAAGHQAPHDVVARRQLAQGERGSMPLIFKPSWPDGAKKSR